MVELTPEILRFAQDDSRLFVVTQAVRQGLVVGSGLGGEAGLGGGIGAWRWDEGLVAGVRAWRWECRLVRGVGGRG